MRTLAAPLCVLLLVTACRSKLSEAEVERHKRAENPGPIAEILAAASATPAVRARAARALVELAADAHFADALKKLDAPTRGALGKDLGADLDALFASAELASQVLAKDFLGLLILAGDRTTAARAGGAIATWMAVDFPNRAALGKVSGVELTRAIGAPALPALQGLLAAPTPRLDLLAIAKLIGGIGDAAASARAAALLGKTATAQGPKLPDHLLRALKALGGAAAAAQLARLAADTKLAFSSRRAAAADMRALGNAAAREIATKLAFTEDEDQFIREDCLVLLEKVCDASCAPLLDGLWKTLAVPGLVFESASAIVKIGGAGTLARLLERLPAGRGYTAKGLENLAEDIAKNVAAAALPALRAAASDGKAPGRLVAFRGLAKLGGPADVALLERLKGDRQVPEGWRFKSSVGQEAERAAADLRKRK